MSFYWKKVKDQQLTQSQVSFVYEQTNRTWSIRLFLGCEENRIQGNVEGFNVVSCCKDCPEETRVGSGLNSHTF